MNDGEDWRIDAACTQVDPELFFPKSGDDGSKAVEVCNRCPVQQQCAQLALDTGARDGIWAGQSTRELRRQARRGGATFVPIPRVRRYLDDNGPCGCDGPLLEDKCSEHYADWLERAISRLPKETA